MGHHNPGADLDLNKTHVCPTPQPRSQKCPFTDPLFSLPVRRGRVTHGLQRDAILNLIFQRKSSGSEAASRSDQKCIIKPAYSYRHQFIGLHIYS